MKWARCFQSGIEIEYEDLIPVIDDLKSIQHWKGKKERDHLRKLRGSGALKDILEDGKKITTFNTPDDLIRDILGAGLKLNPGEWHRIIKELEASGVEIVHREWEWDMVL